MRVLDTSAVLAVLLDEPGRVEIEAAMVGDRCLMSAATRVELGIVVEARAGAAGTQLLEELLDRTGVEIVPFDEQQAREAAVAWRRFGRGRHPAALNLGDVYAFALARVTGAPLLYVGDDFAQTDI